VVEHLGALCDAKQQVNIKELVSHQKSQTKNGIEVSERMAILNFSGLPRALAYCTYLRHTAPNRRLRYFYKLVLAGIKESLPLTPR